MTHFNPLTMRYISIPIGLFNSLTNMTIGKLIYPMIPFTFIYNVSFDSERIR